MSKKCPPRSASRALASPKAEHGEIPPSSQWAATIRPARSLRGVLDQDHSSIYTELLNRQEINRIPKEMGDDYCDHIMTKCFAERR